LKERDLWDDPGRGGIARYWKTSRREEKSGKKLERKHCGKREEFGGFSSIDRYEKETMLEEEYQ
jgi:hypothetical protein